MQDKVDYNLQHIGDHNFEKNTYGNMQNLNSKNF